MDRLKGKTILIGRESGQGRLLVALLGSGKGAAIGGVGSVPGSVSRCRPNEKTAHCKIEIDPSGNMVLTNIKPENVTFVNDLQIQSKKITPSCTISLGRDRYLLDLNLVLQTATKLVGATTPSPTPKTYSIQHLEKVWNRYEATLEAIQRGQQERGKRRMLPMMIGVASSVITALIAFFRDQIYDETVRNFLTILPALVAVISFIIYFRNYTEKDTSIEDKKNAQDKLFDHYVCPNPQCNHFMGNQPYKVLRQNKKCPYCGCSLTDK